MDRKERIAQAQLSLESAEAYSRYAKQLLEKVDRCEKIALGEVIAAASTLIFGIELILKAGAIIEEVPTIKKHELGALYDHLSDERRNRLDHEFNEARKNMSDNWLLRIGLTLTPPGGGGAAPQNVPHAKSIRELLQRHNSAFVDWRYFFERTESPSKYQIGIEIRLLYFTFELLHRDIWKGLASYTSND